MAEAEGIGWRINATRDTRKAPWAGMALAIAFFACLLLIGLWLLQTPPQQAVRLSDTHTVRLVAVTYGTDHLCVDGPQWQRLLLPWVGFRLARQWKWRVQEYHSPTPELLFWTSSPPDQSIPLPITRFVSNEQNSAVPQSSLQALGSGHVGFQALIVRNYPRRGRYVYLNYLFNSASIEENRIVGQFTALNPTPGVFPQWNAPPLPQRRQIGATTFILKRFRVGLGALHTNRPTPNPGVGFSALEFETRNGNGRTHLWRPMEADLANATGANWPSAAVNLGRSKPGILCVPESLGTEEHGWKIGVHFARAGGFTPEETWDFRDLPTPPPLARAGTEHLLTRGNTQIRLRLKPRPRNAPRSAVLVELLISPQSPNSYVSFTGIRDERGRDLTRFGKNPEMFVREDTYKGGISSFWLYIPSGTRRVNLSLALHRSQYVTFLAAPTTP